MRTRQNSISICGNINEGMQERQDRPLPKHWDGLFGAANSELSAQPMHHRTQGSTKFLTANFDVVEKQIVDIRLLQALFYSKTLVSVIADVVLSWARG